MYTYIHIYIYIYILYVQLLYIHFQHYILYNCHKSGSQQEWNGNCLHAAKFDRLDILGYPGMMIQFFLWFFWRFWTLGTINYHLVMTFTVCHGKIHPFWIGKSPCLMGKSPCLIGKSPCLMGHIHHFYKFGKPSISAMASMAKCKRHSQMVIGEPPSSFTAEKARGESKCRMMKNTWRISEISIGRYPLVNQHSNGKSPFLMGKSTINGHFQLLC